MMMGDRRCGTCWYAKVMPQDISKRVCWGAPPTAMQVPRGAGQVTLQMVRPIVAVTDDACALWHDKTAQDITREAEDIVTARTREGMQS